jgi:endoglucanase
LNKLGFIPFSFWHRLKKRDVFGFTSILIVMSLLTNCSFEQSGPPQLGRGMNLGNALESPSEGVWGVTLQDYYFTTIAQAGFNTVRVPIRWPGHALTQAPFTIAPDFFKRVDWVVAQAQKNHLNVILDLHNYDDFLKNPQLEEPRFLAIWKQVAEHYKDAPPSVLFELFNEPHDISPQVWNQELARGLAQIRASNPTRAVIVGPVQWNSISSLPGLELPKDDKNIIVTVHFYEPFHFTHQGAEWVPNSNPWLGTKWLGTPAEKDFIAKNLAQAADWGKAHNRPIFLGEFGAYNKGDFDSRVRWTTEVARDAEHNGISWAYWEFCSTFGAYDPVKKAWRQPLLEALIPGANGAN